MIDSSKEVPSEVVSFDKSSMVLEVKTSDSYKSGRYAIKIRAYNTQSNGAIYNDSDFTLWVRCTLTYTYTGKTNYTYMIGT